MAGATIRLMRPDDIEKISKLTNIEGWTITAFDFSVFRACHPDSFFIAEVDGKPVGSISGVRNDDNTGVLGAYVVEKSYRGKGIGRMLMEKFKEHMQVSEGRNISVNSTEMAVPIYKKAGFTTDAWDVIAYQGPLNTQEVMKFSCEGVEVVRITEANIDMFLDYAAKICPSGDRRPYVRMYLANTEVVYCAAVRKSNQGESVVGIAGAAPCPLTCGCTLQPFYADSVEIGKVMVRFLHLNVPYMAKGVQLETVEPNNSKVLQLVSAMGPLKEAYRFRRLYVGPEISAPFDKVYSLSNADIHLY